MDDVRIASPAKSTGKISPEERARREAAIEYARASVRLEGFVQSAFAEELNRRYIDGEITSEEHSAAVRAHHGL
jgi:hypothetical protein